MWICGLWFRVWGWTTSGIVPRRPFAAASNSTSFNCWDWIRFHFMCREGDFRFQLCVGGWSPGVGGSLSAGRVGGSFPLSVGGSFAGGRLPPRRTTPASTVPFWVLGLGFGCKIKVRFVLFWFARRFAFRSLQRSHSTLEKCVDSVLSV